MTREEAMQQILEDKKEKGLTFESAVEVTHSGKFLPYKRKW